MGEQLRFLYLKRVAIFEIQDSQIIEAVIPFARREKRHGQVTSDRVA
jgi:hypothetical protein